MAVSEDEYTAPPPIGTWRMLAPTPAPSESLFALLEEYVESPIAADRDIMGCCLP